MWQTLESDPGLFTELIERLGVHGVEVREMLSADEASLNELGQIYGLLFLFKYRRREYAEDTDDHGVPAEQAQVVFARQIAENACATQALLAVLLNAQGVDIGPQLTEFRDFVEPLDPESRGDAIAMSQMLQNEHNYMCRPQIVVNDGPTPPTNEEDDGLYHYIAYVPTEHGLFELDGLKPWPIFHGPSSRRNMAEVVCRRMSRHSGDLRVSLLAVTNDMRTIYKERGQPELAAVEQMKREEYALENARRRASHTGLIMTLARQLATELSDSEWQRLLADGRRATRNRQH